MKSFFKYLGVISFLLFGFYYTEKMSYIVNNNSHLMIEINNKKDDYEIKSVNAIIDGDYITPGLYGYRVNVLKSYDKMKEYKVFNELYLSFNKIVPIISINSNKDKIIRRGNPKKMEVSLIVENNQNILDFAKNKNIKLTRLVNKKTYDKNSYFEEINNDFDNYDYLDKRISNDICYYSNYIKSKCNNKYLVESTKYLNNYNLSQIKSNINNGDIIYINDSVSLSDFKILVRQIYYQELKIVYLSKLISEERD